MNRLQNPLSKIKILVKVPCPSIWIIVSEEYRLHQCYTLRTVLSASSRSFLTKRLYGAITFNDKLRKRGKSGCKIAKKYDFLFWICVTKCTKKYENCDIYIASCNDGKYPRRPKTTKTSEDGRNHPVLSHRGSIDNHSSRLCNLYKR